MEHLPVGRDAHDHEGHDEPDLAPGYVKYANLIGTLQSRSYECRVHCVASLSLKHSVQRVGLCTYITSTTHTDYYISGGGKSEMAGDDENESRVLGLGNGAAAVAASRYMPTLIALSPSPVRPRSGDSGPPALCVILRTHHPSIQTMYTVCPALPPFPSLPVPPLLLGIGNASFPQNSNPAGPIPGGVYE